MLRMRVVPIFKTGVCLQEAFLVGRRLGIEPQFFNYVGTWWWDGCIEQLVFGVGLIEVCR